MNKDIKITYGEKAYSYPIIQPSHGKELVDISSLANDLPFYLYDPGFKTTAAYCSKICYIDGEKGILTYRGHPIEELAKEHDFTTISYLLIHGNLPKENSLKDFKNAITAEKENTTIDPIIKSIPNHAHPMSTLLTLVSFLSSQETYTLPIKDPTLQYNMMINLLANMPILVAKSIRHYQGLLPVSPRNDLSYTANFMYMVTGKEVSDLAIKSIDTIFTLHAEHEQNASTSTVRATASTHTHPYAAIVSGISALWGPSHGGANEACIRMLEAIGDIKNIPTYIARAKDKSDTFRLMGFGHRVYRNHDPRAVIMRELCHQLVQSQQEEKLLSIAKTLEHTTLKDAYFTERKLYPNVDFYSGITLRALGIPTACFTLIFTLARTVGWASHWLEMQKDIGPIIRPRQCYQGL